MMRSDADKPFLHCDVESAKFKVCCPHCSSETKSYSTPGEAIDAWNSFYLILNREDYTDKHRAKLIDIMRDFNMETLLCSKSCVAYFKKARIAL